MRRFWLFPLICLLVLSSWSSIAAARAASDPGRGQIEALLRDGADLSQQRKTLDASQKALLLQKQALELTAQQLIREQTALNQQAEAHNKQVAEQAQKLQKNKSVCNNKGMLNDTNTTEHVNECDNEIKALNEKSVEVNQNVPDLGAQQAAVEERVIDNNQKMNSWYRQEQGTVNQLNLVYQNTNDWMDRAYDLFASSHFQSAAHAAHADKYCLASNQPSGTVTVRQLEMASDYALNCLRRVQEWMRE